jgi:hypothetical protein
MNTTLLSGQSYIDLENEFGATNYNPLDVVLVRGQGIWVWDVEDNKYLDTLASFCPQPRPLPSSQPECPDRTSQKAYPGSPGFPQRSTRPFL